MSIIIAGRRSNEMDLEGGGAGKEGELGFDRICGKDGWNKFINRMDEIVEVVKDIYPPITIRRVDESLGKHNQKIIVDRGIAK